MMAITTRSSISVKPDRKLEFAGGTSELCERDFILVDLKRQLKWLRHDGNLLARNQCQCMSLLIGPAKTNCFRPENTFVANRFNRLTAEQTPENADFPQNAGSPIDPDRPWPGFAVNPQ